MSAIDEQIAAAWLAVLVEGWHIEILKHKAGCAYLTCNPMTGDEPSLCACGAIEEEYQRFLAKRAAAPSPAQAAVETDWRVISEEWRIACVEWSAWAASILTQYGLQLPGGKWGHAVAREKIAALIATPGACVPAATSQKGRVEVLETALDHATRSLDAIARRKPLPGVALFESIDEVRDYATSRAAVARAALSATGGS